LVWQIDYTQSAREQLRKLDRQTAQRIVDFMAGRVAQQNNPRDFGKALTGSHDWPLRYRAGRKAKRAACAARQLLTGTHRRT